MFVSVSEQYPTYMVQLEIIQSQSVYIQAPMYKDVIAEYAACMISPFRYDVSIEVQRFDF